MLRLQMERLRKPEEHGVVLILSASDWQKAMITNELIRMDPSLAPPSDSDGDAKQIVEVNQGT